jgi:O-antigen ligase
MALRPVCVILTSPSLIFFAFLTAALFRPPGVQFFPWDRVAFGALTLALLLRTLVRRQRLYFHGVITWPVLGLLVLSGWGIAIQPYDAQAISVFAAKWLVPFAMFHAASMLWDEPKFLARFEWFSIAILAYLIFVSIAFLVGATGLIFPAYILNESLGLQAVANGMTLNLLGLIALNAFRRKRLHGPVGFLILGTLPLAILATRTRSVWLGFAGSILLLFFRSPDRRLRSACKGWAIAAVMALVACVNLAKPQQSLADRLEDRSPVQFRMAVYQAGWEMFQARPLLGWNGDTMRTELGKRISDFHQDVFYFHNTYLEILVEHGLLGLGLYVWLAFGLFRVGSRGLVTDKAFGKSFLDMDFRSAWPIFVLVFLVNGSFVVMNYQFVNGLLFALAGMLAAQNRQLESMTRVA